MDETLRFVTGEVFEEVFKTAFGWVVFSADIEIKGRMLRFLEVDVRPLEHSHLLAGPAAMLVIRRTIFQYARAEGDTSFELEAWRVSGANPGRTLLLRGNL